MSAIVCVAVCGRGSVSPTHPVAGPTVENAMRRLDAEISRTLAMERIGEIFAMRFRISCSTGCGTR